MRLWLVTLNGQCIANLACQSIKYGRSERDVRVRRGDAAANLRRQGGLNRGRRAALSPPGAPAGRPERFPAHSISVASKGAAIKQHSLRNVSSHLESRVLVTGGAGFLGSHLCERLVAAGADVLCVDNYFTGRKDNIAHLLGAANFEAKR